LQSRYQVRFESELSAATSLRNYEYLGILDEAWSSAGLALLRPGTLCDVGCASFWYAAALDAFFHPRRLVGVEVEGYRLFKDARTRIDHAAGYVALLPNARFVVADYLSYREPADLITAWFPFVTPAAILAWRLPLSLLRPARLFGRVCANLNEGGMFLMVNHGRDEADLAAQLCVAAGLAPVWSATATGVLCRYREAAPVVSCWRHGTLEGGQPISRNNQEFAVVSAEVRE
jgi:hypothetical protein